METADLLLSLIIIIIFALLYLYNILGIKIQRDKDIWPLNRCNPAYMSQASRYGFDPTTNFNNCVQNVQISNMSELLLPVNYNIKNLQAAGDEIAISVTDTKSFINRFRNDVANIVKNIMTVILNLTINIEKSNVNIKDALSRLTGVLTTLTYYNEGSQIALKSAQKSKAQADAEAKAKAQADELAKANALLAEIRADVIAKALKAQADEKIRADELAKTRDQAISLSQSLAQTQALAQNCTPGADAVCFHPDTLVQTFDSQFIKIKDLKLSDHLKNGQTIYATMKLNNLNSNNDFIEDLYLLERGEQSKPILVSGSHLVYDPTILNYIHVKDHPASIKTTINSATLICLITSDHTIPLGDYIFHDWEDNNGSPSKI